MAEPSGNSGNRGVVVKTLHLFNFLTFSLEPVAETITLQASVVGLLQVVSRCIVAKRYANEAAKVLNNKKNNFLIIL